MPDQRLTFKEMCATFEVTPRTLRYYEYIELLAPEKEGRKRFYTSREVARMKLILRGRKYGFSLEEIRQWLMLYEQDGTKVQAQAFVALADRQLDALKQQQRELADAIAELSDLRDQTVARAQSAD